MREVVGIGKLRQHAAGLLGYLERNKAAPAQYAARRRRAEPIASTAALNDTLKHAFRRRHHGYRPANDDHTLTTAAA